MDSNNMNNNTSNTNDAYNAGADNTGTEYTTYTAYTTDGSYGAGNYTAPTTSIQAPVIEESRKGLGIVAAIIGAILGGVVWTLVGYAGYIAAPVAILIFWLASTGYKKFGKKEDTFGYIFSGILVLIVVTIATYMATALDVQRAFDEIGKSKSFYRVLRNLNMYMRRYDLWGSFIANLVIGYLFSIAATAGTIVSRIKELNQKKNQI